MRKPGCIEPVIYFRYRDGHINLAPYSDFPTPDDAIREYADTLDAVDRLEAILQRQEYDAWEREAERNEALIAPRMIAIRDALYARMTSSSTSEYEKEFLKYYMQLREDKKAKYRQRWLEREMYLHARHNDIGKRRADEEVFRPERHTVQS